MVFYKEYKAVWFENNQGRTLHLTCVESNGTDLDDLLSNAMISLETDHGNEGPDWTLGDLPDSVYNMIEQDMSEAIREARSMIIEGMGEL